MLSLSLRPLLPLLLVCVAFPAFAQKKAPQPSGEISGRITIDGEPAQGVAVFLMKAEREWGAKPTARATTDTDGRYTLANLAAGRYGVVPHAPAHVAPREFGYGGEGKAVTIEAGERVADINMALARGGVITGRITNEDGEPVIEESIYLTKVDEQGKPIPNFFFNSFEHMTDDQGVYRIYGVAPGRYLVSAGKGGRGGMIVFGMGGGFYARTYYPDARDEAKATPIEIEPGTERTGIDIKLGRPSRTFVATGRFVDGESGQPVPNVMYGHGTIQDDGKSIGAMGFSGGRTNSRGEFRVEGLLPDKYGVFPGGGGNDDTYSDPAIFEIRDADVSGLEVKVHKGATISGRLVIEPPNAPPSVRASLATIQLYASPMQRMEGVDVGRFSGAKVNADGTFQITGLRAGKYRISVGNYPTPPKNLTLARIEQNGVEVPEGAIEVAAGKQTSGVQLVLAYGTSVIRGQARVEGGELPAGAVLYVQIKKLGGAAAGGRQPVQVDTNRRFVFDGLAAGEYELTLYPNFTGSSPPQRIPPARQNVTVSGEGEMQVALTLDLSAQQNKEPTP